MAVTITTDTAEDNRGYYLKGLLVGNDGTEWGQWQGAWRYKTRNGVDIACELCRTYIAFNAKLPNLSAHHEQWGEFSPVRQAASL